MSMGEISPNFGENRRKNRRKMDAGEKSAKSSKNRRTLQFIGEFSVCIADFFPIFRKISRYFLPVQPAQRIQNLIMICRQRLCFLAWLKNRGFRVREI